MTADEHIGVAIYWARKERKMSQRELAERAGVSRSRLSHVECGDENPSEDWLAKIREALDVEREDLV